MEKDFGSALDQDLPDVKFSADDSDANVLTDGSFTEDVESDYPYGAAERSYKETKVDLLVPKNEPDF